MKLLKLGLILDFLHKSKQQLVNIPATLYLPQPKRIGGQVIKKQYSQIKITAIVFFHELIKIFCISAFQIKTALSTAIADIVTMDIMLKKPCRNPLISHAEKETKLFSFFAFLSGQTSLPQSRGQIFQRGNFKHIKMRKLMHPSNPPWATGTELRPKITLTLSLILKPDPLIKSLSRVQAESTFKTIKLLIIPLGYKHIV